MLQLRNDQMLAFKSAILDRFTKHLELEIATKYPMLLDRYGKKFSHEVKYKVIAAKRIGFTIEKHIAFFATGALLFPEKFEHLVKQAINPAEIQTDNFHNALVVTEPLFMKDAVEPTEDFHV